MEICESIMAMSGEELETRMSELEAATNEKDADLDAIEKEVDEINERTAQLKKEAEERNALLDKIAEKRVETKVIEERKEETKMDVKEIRNSAEYVEAFANYIKTGKADECRSLLTTNVEGGTVAVPDFVLDEIKTAWENNDIMSLVQKTEFAGNLKVQFEIDGDPAVVHTEGGAAVTEEELALGIVTLVPASIKKWISISDEALDLRGEAFLRYIYAEISRKIVKKAADLLIAAIVALPDTATATTPSAQAVSANPALGTIAQAYANLSDEATKPVIIINKLTHANFKAIQYAGQFPVDPFEGLDVHYSSALPAFDTASVDDVYAIVGDFGYGAIANFPKGEGVEIKVDDKTDMTKDLVRILGREYVGLGVVACNAFTLIKKVDEA